MKWIAVLIASAGSAAAEEIWPFTAIVDACLVSDDPASCVGDAAIACMDSDPEQTQTTFGMMTCFLQGRDAWDAHLNEEYRKARAYAQSLDASDQDFFPQYAVRDDQVRDAQRAWLAFRDANCAMEYGLWGAGSMRQIAGAQCLLQMTADQTIALQTYQGTMR